MHSNVRGSTSLQHGDTTRLCALALDNVVPNDVMVAVYGSPRGGRAFVTLHRPILPTTENRVHAQADLSPHEGVKC